MLRLQLIAVAVLAALAATAGGDEVSFVTENGIVYRQTRRMAARPVAETQMQQSTRTVYREQWTTEQRDCTRTCLLPVTEYRLEHYWVGLYNPFVQPYVAARWVPTTRWEAKTETHKTPLYVRRVVPETQTVQTPVATQRYVWEEVVDRVPVGTAPPPGPQWVNPAPAYAGAAPSVSPGAGSAPLGPAPAQPLLPPSGGGPSYAPPTGWGFGAAQPQVGGVARLDQDPPRYGTDPGWRPATQR